MKNFFLYRIYYDNRIVYIGRTTQPLTRRLYQHMNKPANLIKLNPLLVDKVEFAECCSEADMCLYEVYYINLLHPELNEDAKAEDELTLSLPPLNWSVFPIDGCLREWGRNERDRRCESSIQRQSQMQKENLIAEYEQKYRDGLFDRKTLDAFVEQTSSIFGEMS